MIDRRRLDLLPRHAGVAIVGRAKVFDCDALLDKLADESLAGAVLDVFPEEPLPPESRFWKAPNLVITPHCSVDDRRLHGPLRGAVRRQSRALSRRRAAAERRRSGARLLRRKTPPPH